MEERSTAGTGLAGVVVCGPASRTWRRELEELALTARHDDQGWASPAGIRAIAIGIGTTHAAALRAIAALARAGLVALEPATDQWALPLPLPLRLSAVPPPGYRTAPYFAWLRRAGVGPSSLPSHSPGRSSAEESRRLSE
jgi:hypothetical protein